MYMYYLLSFKLLRRKQGGHNVSQHTTRLDAEFIGFSEFLRCLPEDKRRAQPTHPLSHSLIVCKPLLQAIH